MSRKARILFIYPNERQMSTIPPAIAILSELLKRKHEPNPILFNELKKLLNHFTWNWDEFWEKHLLQLHVDVTDGVPS